MKRKKSLKGMTLIECLIALGIFGIMSVILITSVVNVYNSRKNSKRIIKNTVYEAPVAAARATEPEVAIDYTNDHGNSDPTDDTYPKIKIEGSYIDFNVYRAKNPNNNDEGYTYFSIKQ